VKRWYAVQTQVRSEQKAESNLLRQGYEIYCPRLSKYRRHARKTDIIVVPLFPGYLFTLLDINEQGWRSINGTYGVCQIVGFGGRPSPVPEGLVEAIAGRQVADGIVEPPLTVFRDGDKVLIEDGPFKGVVGEFMRLKESDRILVLLDIMGRKVSTEAHLSVVSAAI
jgi:transcriptional antiterminator RfaH